MQLDRSAQAQRMGRMRRRSALVLALAVVASVCVVSGPAAARATPAAKTVGCSCLRPGDSLRRGQSLRSPDGRFVLWLQGDGNLVEYAVGGNHVLPLWVRGDRSAWVLWMQNDGNLVLYRQDGTPIWWSQTGPHPNNRVVLQSDANLVVSSATWTPRWANRAQAPRYNVRNVGSQKCLWGQLAPHEIVEQQPCDVRSGNQIFYLDPLGGDRYMIRNWGLRHPDKCLEVPNHVATSVPLQYVDCVKSVGQTFRFSPTGPSGRGSFVTATSTTEPFSCVGVVGSSTADGAAVGQASCDGGTGQLWDLVPWTIPS